MNLLFDFDEVIVDINTGALKYINEKLGTTYQLEDLTSWDFYDNPSIRQYFVEFLLQKDVYQKDAIPNWNMIECIKTLVESGENVKILTASIDGSHESKENFIREYMPFLNIKNVYVINSTSPYKNKSEVLNDLHLDYYTPTILIDDGIHNILDIMADERHKDQLNDTMKRFYSNKSLKKFNNPYHDFVYGIIPELPYNKDINDGKRIFKIKHTQEIWNKFKEIESSHKNRIHKKQNDLLFYLENKLNSIEPPHSNIMYLLKNTLKNNEYKEVVERSYVLSYKLKNSSLSIDELFHHTDCIFKTDIMYQDIKNLIKAIYTNSIDHSTIPVAQYYSILCDEGINLNKIEKISNENIELSQMNNEFLELFLKNNGFFTEDKEEKEMILLKLLNDDVFLKGNQLERSDDITSISKKYQKNIKNS